jgi:2',3'-cyclic-nucleotide 2'-phosphodiesterase (5'-nucleotidase family)
MTRAAAKTYHSGSYVLGPKPTWETQPAYGYRGMLDIPLFGMLGLDAFCLGNHEFDYGFWWAGHLFKTASFDVLGANVVPKKDNLPFNPFYKPYAVYKKGNFTIGVIGMVTDEHIFSGQVKMTDPAAAAPLIRELERTCDLVIVLSHLGHSEDKKLARAVSGIDVIVGGHSHTYLPNPVMVNETIITQAGSFGEFVGRLDIAFENGLRKSFNYALLPVDVSVPEDPEIFSFFPHFWISHTLSFLLYRFILG